MSSALAAKTTPRPAAAPFGARLTASHRPTITEPGKAAALVASAHNQQLSGGRLTAALADVVVGDGTTGILSTVSQDTWLGELWTKQPYQRRYVGLCASGPITGMKVKGWRWVTPPELDDWAGNKTDVPSNPVDVESLEATVRRLAGAWDVGREFWDLGDAGFIQSFWEKTTESYARKSDMRALAAISTAAAENPIAGLAAPAGVSKASAALIDGIVHLVPDFGVPDYAIVSPDLYRDFLLVRQDDALAHINTTLNLDEGSLGGMTILPGRTGQIPAGKVIVGMRPAVKFFELGSVPIRVEAENVAKGGRDLGAFGYTSSLVEDPNAVVMVSVAA